MEDLLNVCAIIKYGKVKMVMFPTCEIFILANDQLIRIPWEKWTNIFPTAPVKDLKTATELCLFMSRWYFVKPTTAFNLQEPFKLLP